MHNLKSGQALIMLVLIIALIMTIVAATSFRLTTEIQSSKLQEESVRALAAADAGIEAGLLLANTAGLASSQYSFNDDQVGIDVAGIDLSRSRVTITETSDTEFISQQILQDDQLTFYLQEYPNYGTSYTGDLTILFGSEGGSECGSGAGGRTVPAIELSFIQGTSSDEVRKEILEPCALGTFQVGGTGHITVSAVPETVGGATYNYSASVSGLDEYEVMFMRSLFENTRFVVRSNTPFPRQGKLIRSEAYSISGPSKIVTVFQSSPQLPADFFVTTF
jgi:hypothetical protein